MKIQWDEQDFTMGDQVTLDKGSAYMIGVDSGKINSGYENWLLMCTNGRVVVYGTKKEVAEYLSTFKFYPLTKGGT